MRSLKKNTRIAINTEHGYNLTTTDAVDFFHFVTVHTNDTRDLGNEEEGREHALIDFLVLILVILSVLFKLP